jgi:hypothetical protein
MHAFLSSPSFFAAIASAALCAGLQVGTAAGTRDMVVWYKQPAKAWMDASPLKGGIQYTL